MTIGGNAAMREEVGLVKFSEVLAPSSGFLAHCSNCVMAGENIFVLSVF